MSKESAKEVDKLPAFVDLLYHFFLKIEVEIYRLVFNSHYRGINLPAKALPGMSSFYS